MKKQVVVISIDKKIVKVCEIKEYTDLKELQELKEKAVKNELEMICDYERVISDLNDRVSALEESVKVLKGEE